LVPKHLPNLGSKELSNIVIGDPVSTTNCKSPALSARNFTNNQPPRPASWLKLVSTGSGGRTKSGVPQEHKSDKPNNIPSARASGILFIDLIVPVFMRLLGLDRSLNSRRPPSAGGVLFFAQRFWQCAFLGSTSFRLERQFAGVQWQGQFGLLGPRALRNFEGDEAADLAIEGAKLYLGESVYFIGHCSV
jgi:hypothetical protein